MTKKKFFAGMATAAMLTSMLASTAFAADWNTQGGDAEVEGGIYPVEPSIEVAIPGDLTFGVNPLGLNVSETEVADTRQIVSADYAITNYSNVPVVVDANVTLTAGSDVTLATSAEYDDNTAELKPAGANKKNAFVTLSVAKSVTYDKENGIFKYTYGTVDENVKDADTAKAQASKVLATAVAAENHFMLDPMAVKEDGDLEDGINPSVAFTLKGAVDPQATFVEGDLTVKTVYKLNAISTKQKAGYEADTTTLTGAAASYVKAK